MCDFARDLLICAVDTTLRFGFPVIWKKGPVEAERRIDVVAQ
jgi:hypothetical protein